MNQKLPQHVAIVMDGNGRWAENRGLPRMEGHRAGLDAVRSVVKCCLEKKIATLSLFAFSIENWLRPEVEVDFLMHLFIEALAKEINELYANGVCLRFIGERHQLSAKLRDQMFAAEEACSKNSKLTLNLAVNYSGQWDIIQAARTMALQLSSGVISAEQINEQLFKQLLNTKDLSDPDLFIRTSGEQRISNFFLWQLAYTELYFSRVHWPDFNDEEFEKALFSFSRRERRYGRIPQQINDGSYDV
ncbi:MAG: polyprenyl diphosphate synthase [Legionella sp.]